MVKQRTGPVYQAAVMQRCSQENKAEEMRRSGEEAEAEKMQGYNEDDKVVEKHTSRRGKVMRGSGQGDEAVVKQ